jgi:predicted enzyme related to lactoylglutathione lyase
VKITDVLAVQIVRDHDEAVAWYASLFGREPDRRPMDPSAEWDLGPGAGVQVYLDPDHAGGHTMIIAVDDVQAVLGELAGRGIDGESFVVPSGQYRLCQLHDPSGNVVMLSQTLDTDE